LKIPEELARNLRAARHVTILTGAGISAESGIPTFREAQTGLWAKYDPEELATPQAFRANPDLVRRWYRWRQEIVMQADPNPGHLAISRMESILVQRGSRFTLITQNVDGLHQRAGNQNVIELHGNINRGKCLDCGTIAEDKSYTLKNSRCVQCGGLLRPDVVWYGENLPAHALHAAWEAAENCDIFFSIGTSAVVQPAASLPVIALQKGAVVVELNPNNTPISILVSHSLQGFSGKILPQLIEATWPDYG